MLATRRSGVALAHLVALCLLLGCGPSGPDGSLGAASNGTRIELDLGGEGWRLWLDEDAGWEDDTLLAPPVDLAGLKVPDPTIGWDAMAAQGVEVSVPGTVEQSTWPERGDYVGVSWWWRTFELPDLAGEEGAPPRVVRLRFGAVRQRAEIILNRHVVGYDAVGNTPFELDVTHAVQPGLNRLAVRVTDPGGNFSWEDFDALAWGDQTIPASHGFGGITGGVSVSVLSPLHVADVFVKNTPLAVDPHDPAAAPEMEIDVTLRNDDAEPAACDVLAEITDADDPSRVVFAGRLGQVAVPPGESLFSQRVTIENARWWSPDDPHLYRCRITLWSRHGPGGAYAATDSTAVRFGVRTFEIDGLGEDAVLRLNGERIVLRSAISWGFWPTSGMVPTPELARRQVQSAQALG
ncbi:MAG: sugar-binding domain-containing protein, partial [Planctomycetota bacterium]